VERGLTFVHPFDDPVVLAGRGTAGLEIVGGSSRRGAVVVAVGRRGAASAACATRCAGLLPTARIVAVELAEGPGMGPALAAGKPVPGAAARGDVARRMTPPFVGALPLQIVQRDGCSRWSDGDRGGDPRGDARADDAGEARRRGAGAAGRMAAIASGVVRFEPGAKVGRDRVGRKRRSGQASGGCLGA
jgi:hypothetical protein